MILVSRNRDGVETAYFQIGQNDCSKTKPTSFASVISVLSIVFYCVGFIRVELELNQHKKRLNDLENVAETKPPSNGPDIKIIKDAAGKFFSV